MIELINQALSYIGTVLNTALMTVANFFLGFLPERSTDVYNLVHGAVTSLSAWIRTSTFNLFYFFDFSYIYTAFSVVLALILAALLYRFVMFVISIVHKLLDSIPVIG